MPENSLTSFALIFFLGMAAQWLAWRLRFPSIIFLFACGFLFGPILGWLQPNQLFGDLLIPLVSLSVALILFEGGLSLRIKELREIGFVVLALVSVGVLVTWGVISLAAYFVLKLDLAISVLLGAVLVVTGPTVIGPLLRHVQVKGRVADILKWEGIVIDPICAMLAVLVFQVILIGNIQNAGYLMVLGIIKTIVLGGLTGVVFALALVLLLKHFWIPDFLEQAVTLSLVISAFVVSNLIQAESGLFTVTVMGLVLVNQWMVAVKRIVEFKESLRVLIISSLFIILAARIDIADFSIFTVSGSIFLAIILFVARPAAVFASTIKSDLKLKEKVLLSWMAPRGIIAAAVSSVFALKLSETGLAQAEVLVPITFIVIASTVTIYGLTAKPLAQTLKLTQSDPRGMLILGAHKWARAIATALKENEFKVALIDTNRLNVKKARSEGLPAHYGNALAEEVIESMNLDGIGRFLALTSNDEANSLAILHFDEIFERSSLYQLSPEVLEGEDEESFSPKHLRGRFLFDTRATFSYLRDRFYAGAVIKTTHITEEFDNESYGEFYGESAIKLFIIDKEDDLTVVTTDEDIQPKPGQLIVAIVDPRP